MCEKVVFIFLATFWIICLVINIIYTKYDMNKDYFDQNVYLPLIGYSFVVPQVVSLCEAWANALMLSLFKALQSDDYNRKLNFVDKKDSKKFNDLKKALDRSSRSSSKKSIYIYIIWFYYYIEITFRMNCFQRLLMVFRCCISQQHIKRMMLKNRSRQNKKKRQLKKQKSH